MRYVLLGVMISSCWLATVPQFGYAQLKVFPSFPSVDDPSWLCSDRHCLCRDSVPDTAQREDSGGLSPVATWSQCEGGQYLTFYVSL